MKNGVSSLLGLLLGLLYVLSLYQPVMQNKANFGDALHVTRGRTRENPNEYVPCNVSTVSFLVIFAKSLLEKVDRRCGKLLNS